MFYGDTAIHLVCRQGPEAAEGAVAAVSRGDEGPGQDPLPPMQAILAALREGEKFLVCSHSRPDGDAVGSMLAMGMLLRQMGKRADIVAADRVPAVYRGLPGAEEIRHAMRVHGPYDAVVLLECDGLERTRLRGLERMFHINIDHHASGKEFGELNWIDRDACSVGELVHRLVKAAGCTVTRGDGDLPLYNAADRYRRLLLRRHSRQHIRAGRRAG